MNMRHVAVGVLGATLLAQVPAPAATNTPAIQHTEQTQRQLRQSTQAVTSQISALLAEFERNDLAGDDLQMLRTIQSILTRLSDEQMQRVITLLQQARLLDASAAQKSIVIQLRQLLLEYQRHQTLLELANRLNELAIRQNNNLAETLALAQWNSNETQRVSLDLQQTEQQSLHDEVQPILAKLASLTQDADTWSVQACRQGMRYAEEQQLLPVLAAAAADLRDGQLTRAAGQEKQARDTLRQLARQLLPLDKPAALRQAIQEVAQAEDQQKQLIEETRKTGFSKTAAPQLEKQQARIADKTDQLRQDLQAIAPVAAAALEDAAKHMENARPALTATDKPAALTQAKAALAKLTTARADLQKQVAEPEQPSPTPAETVARLKELQQQTAALATEQARLQQATAAAQCNRKTQRQLAAQETALHDQTEALVKNVASQAPAAVAPLAEAADQMAVAGTALTEGKAPERAAAAQAAAQTQLAQANQQLAAATTRAEQDQHAAEAGPALRAELAKLITAQQQAQLQTATASAPALELAQTEGQLAQAAQQLAPQLAAVTPPAATAATAASGQMTKAQAALARQDRATAQGNQTDAIHDLLAAKDAVEDRLADLPAAPATDPAALGETAAALAQTEENVSQAARQLQSQSQTRAAATTLGKAAVSAGQLAANTRGAARQSLQEAQRALTTASSQAAANQPAAALGSTATAQESLAQAQATLAMHSATATGRGQPGQAQPNQPGGVGSGNLSGPDDDRNTASLPAGGGQFIGLPPRDRAAIRQSQSEKYPPEYGPQIEQYLRNLAEQAENPRAP